MSYKIIVTMREKEVPLWTLAVAAVYRAEVVCRVASGTEISPGVYLIKIWEGHLWQNVLNL